MRFFSSSNLFAKSSKSTSSPVFGSPKPGKTVLGTDGNSGTESTGKTFLGAGVGIFGLVSEAEGLTPNTLS